jgi:hypothetical protein
VVGGGGGGISGVDRGEISGLNGDGAEQWAASKHYRQMVPSFSRRRCAEVRFRLLSFLLFGLGLAERMG